MAGRKLTRIHSLKERVGDTFSANPNELIAIFSRSEGNFVLELDFEPNNDFFLSPSMLESIGNGVTHLNGFLSSKLFQDKESWYPMIHFLQAHNHNGMSMMLNDKIQSLGVLRSALRKAEEHLLSIPQDTPYSEFDLRFQELCLEKGWGDTAKRAGENIRLLLDLLEVPDPSNLEKFLSTIPMMFTVVILSPNGCFGQANVLGYPGTGGQIVYTLDRVHPLEDEMLLRIKEQGLDIPPKILLVARFPPDAIETTTCGQPLEIVNANGHTSVQLGRFLPPLSATATALTLIDILAAVFGLFGLGSTALQILNMATLLLDMFIVHLTIVISGGCPLVRRRLGGVFSVSRAYNLAKLAVFLTGALALLLVVAEPHFESVRLSRC